MKKTFAYFFFSFVLCIVAVFSCRHTDSFMLKSRLTNAQQWFESQNRSSFNEVFQNATVEWGKAKEKVLSSNNRVIVVPMREITKHSGYSSKRLLYLYPFRRSTGFAARIVEFEPSIKYVATKKGKISAKDFTGLITAWDLKKGFVRGLKFENAIAVGSLQFKRVTEDYAKTNFRKSASSSKLKQVRTDDWLPPVTVVSNPVYQGGNNTFFSFYTLTGVIFDFSLLSGPGNNPCEYTDCNINNLDDLFQDEDFFNEAAHQQWEDDQDWLKEKVKDSSNDPCIDAILKTFATLNNTVAMALRCNTYSDPDFSTVIKTANLGNSRGGTTNMNTTSQGDYEITINSNFDGTITTLSKAASLLHEMAHAQILALYNKAVTLGDTASQRYVAENFGYVIKDDVDAMNTFGFWYNLNGDTHNVIQMQYIGPFSGILNEFASKEGITVSSQYIQDLLWSGLQQTWAFQDMDESERKRIQGRIDAEKTGTGLDQWGTPIEPVGKKCP
ncbi:hypothetical protein GWC95_11185 [Sediminibacterium roseum]|uniref:Uncharacterized protein n=1 Tax=Sediminibacterium roseum TaxID=1978412 RepID=A0ABW9ZTM4_9BACT|nr:hypothetical protein [Sediminibacterium roseum]NCI50489.1 hypothetical protein [Sediminibacterium roseum]